VPGADRSIDRSEERRAGRDSGPLWLCPATACATIPHHSFRPCPLFRQTVASGYCCCHRSHSPAERPEGERDGGRSPSALLPVRLCLPPGLALPLMPFPPNLPPRCGLAIPIHPPPTKPESEQRTAIRAGRQGSLAPFVSAALCPLSSREARASSFKSAGGGKGNNRSDAFSNRAGPSIKSVRGTRQLPTPHVKSSADRSVGSSSSVTSRYHIDR
jgi:hypothetical protein